MSDVLIKVEDVSKKFAKDLKKSLLYGIADVGRGILGKTFDQELRADEFWAVQDISFEVRRGECLGLIGHNGAGKSTLLKMLNGLIRPDKGRIEMRGRVGALIELGAGFNPILTGRENIFNSGAVLGFTRAEMNKKFDEIVAFSELEDFLDMPVQNYSSGMRVRLGFAVAAQLEPDVLLIDEVLAVGDIGFRVKCLNKISSLMQNSAIVLVSHSMTQISRVCNYGILLSNGEVILNTHDIGDLIQSYLSIIKNLEEPSLILGSRNAEISNIQFDGFSKNENGDFIAHGNFFQVKINLNVEKSVDRFSIHLFVIDSESKPIAIVSSLSDSVIFINDKNIHLIEINIPIFLSDGRYTIHITLVEILPKNKIGETLISKRNIASFICIRNTYPTTVSIQIPAKWKYTHE